MISSYILAHQIGFPLFLPMCGSHAHTSPSREKITRKTITCVTCYKRRCWKVLMSNNRWRIIIKFFSQWNIHLKRLWNESLNAWRFANKLFNQTVIGKQVFLNTCYLQSFMKTNTCPRGKKKLDCITSLDIQYLKRKSLRKSQLSWVPKWYPMHFPPSYRNKSKPSHEFAGDRKNLLTRTSGQTNQMTYFPRLAFNLSYFLIRLFSLLIHI